MKLDKNFGAGFSLIFEGCMLQKCIGFFDTDCGSKLLFNFEYHDVLGGVKNV